MASIEVRHVSRCRRTDRSGPRLQPLLHKQARRARPAPAEEPVLAERGAGTVRIGAPGNSTRPATLSDPRPGDIGWEVQSHGAFHACEHGFDSSFEALVAEIAAKFLTSFDGSWERCWIAEVDGAQVGSVYLVRRSD